MEVRPAPVFDFEEEAKATPEADPSLLTGKDIFEYMQMNRKARFSNDEMGRKSFRMMMEYMDNRKTDFIGAAENAVGMMIEELGGLADAPLNPAKFAASTAEGAAKGIQDMYGIFAQSEDPGSWGFKLKSYLMRLAGKDDGDIDSQIRQFHEARDFNNRSYEHMEGKGTILGDYLPEGWKSTYEGLVDPKFATALSYAVLDIPEWFFSAGASTPQTALKLAASATAKSAKATWAARAVERLGGYGTNLIGKGMDVAAGKTLEAAGAVIRAPFKAIYGASAAATQLAGDYAGNAVRNASTAAAVEMGAEVMGSTLRHPAMGFMRSIGLEALGELAQTAGADIVDRALGKAMVKPDAIGMTTLERLASGTARGAETMSREAQMLAVGVNATVGWATSMSSSALKAMFRDGVIGAGIGYVNSREEGAGAGVGMGVAWGGLSGTVRHMGAYTRFQHQDQLVVDNFKTYGIEAFRRVLGPTGYESAKRFSEHIQGYGDLRTSAIEMAHLQTLIAHEGGLMGAGNVNFYFGDVAKNPNELTQLLVDMKMKPGDIQANVAQVANAAGAMMDFKDANGASKKVLVLNSEHYKPTTGRHEVAHLLLRSVAEANGDMEYIRGFDPASQSTVNYKIFRPNYLLNLLGASKDMGIMPDKALNAMVQSYTALKVWNDFKGMDEATAKQIGMAYANAVETFRDYYSKGRLNLQDPEVVKLVSAISTAMEEAFAYYHGGLSNILPVDQYTKDPAARNMLRAWAENRAARKNSLIMSDLEMAGVEIRARLTNPDGSPKLFSDQTDANGNPVPVFDSFLFDDGKMLRTPGMDAWIDMVMRQAYSRGEVLTSTMDPFRQEALAKAAGKTHLFNSVAGGGMRLKSPKELDELSTQQAQKILGAAGSVPEDVRPLVEVDQEGATKIKLESISSEALESIRQSGAFTKQEWDAMMGMVNIVQRNRQGAMHHNVLNATLLAHTMQVRKGASVIRLTGKDVPVTYRSFVPLSVEVYVKTHDAQGNPLRSPKGGVLIHSLDVAAENRRLQKVFKRADVQQLFGGNFEEFVKTFNAYVINQSGLNGARVPTADLFRPKFGAEAERVRDVMYEAFGGRKTKDAAWINEPANGYRGGADDPNRPFFTMRFDTMADIQVQPTAWNPYSRVPFFPYIHNIAYEGVTKNFQLTGFAASPLANGGMMFRNRQGFEIFESKKGYALFDPFGIKVGVFKTAAKAMKKAAKDAGEIDEADTIPDNAVYDNNPHNIQPDEVTSLTSTFMYGGRVSDIAGKLGGGKSEMGMKPAEYLSLISQTSPKFRFSADPAAPAASMHDFHPATTAGIGLVQLPNGDFAQPKKFIRFSELFGSAATKIDGIDIPSEEGILNADNKTKTTNVGGDQKNLVMSFSPEYIRAIRAEYGDDFANELIAYRAATSLVVATATRNGSIPIPSFGGAANATHAMDLAKLFSVRDSFRVGDKSGTNYHENNIDTFVGSEQLDALNDMATRVKMGQAHAYSFGSAGDLKAIDINPFFASSALSIRATFGTLDWAKSVINNQKSGGSESAIALAAARAILSAVSGEMKQDPAQKFKVETVRTANLDFMRAYTEAKLTFGTEQNSPEVGGLFGGFYRFNDPANPDHVLMFNDAMVDLSGLTNKKSAVAKVVRDIESHHFKFMQSAKARMAAMPAGSTLGMTDDNPVRSAWMNGLDELIPGLSSAFTDVLLQGGAGGSYVISARGQSYLNAWHDSAQRVKSNGGIFKKTVVGKFGANGKLEKLKSGAKAGIAWMELSNVNDLDVEDVLTHRSIYEGIQDAVSRHASGDQTALADAAILYGAISGLANDNNPFFHLIKPPFSRIIAGGTFDTFNRSIFEDVRKSRQGKLQSGAGTIHRPYSKPKASVYDLPASRSYVTQASDLKNGIGSFAVDRSAELYLESSVNSADPARYKQTAEANAVIGTKRAPVILSTRGTKKSFGSISAIVDTSASSQMTFISQTPESTPARNVSRNKMTVVPEAFGAGAVNTYGNVMDVSGSTYSPAFLAIALQSMDAAGNFDFAKQISKVDKDISTWFGMYSGLRGVTGRISEMVRKEVSQAQGDSKGIAQAYAKLTKMLLDNGVSHDQAMHAEKLILARIAIQEAIESGNRNGPEVLAALAEISDAMLHSEETRQGGTKVGGVPRKQLDSYVAMIGEYKKTGAVQLESTVVQPGKTIEGDNRLMLVGRRAEAHLSKERKEILAGLGLVGKIRDAHGKEHTYFEISDARASLNTATFSSGLTSPLVRGLADADRAIEGAVLSRIGQQSRADLDAIIDNFNSQKFKLSDIIVHDELFALYPEIAKLEVTCIHGMSCAFDPTGAKGFVIGVDNFLRGEYASSIDMNSKSPRAGESMAYEGHGVFPDYESNFRDVVLHEIQHSIQNAEDWRDVAFNADAGRYAVSPGVNDPKFTEAGNPEGYLTPLYVGAARALGSDENIGIMGPFEGDNSATSDVVKMLRKYFADHDKLANIITRDTGYAGMRTSIGYAPIEEVMRAVNAIVNAPMAKVLMADEIPSIVRASERFDVIMDLMELALSKRASEFDADGLASITDRIRIGRESNRKIKAKAIEASENVKNGSNPLIEAGALSGVVQTFLPHITITDPSMSVLAKDVVGSIDYVAHMQDFATAPLRRSLNKLAYALGNTASSMTPHQANLRIAEVVHGLMKSLYMQDPMEIMARETEARSSMDLQELAKKPRKTFDEIVTLPEALRVGLFTREMVGAEFGMNISPGLFSDFKNDNLLMIGGSKGSSKLSSEVFNKNSALFELGLRHMARASLLTHFIRPDQIRQNVKDLAYQSRGWRIGEDGKAVYVISQGTLNVGERKGMPNALQDMLNLTIGTPRRDNESTALARAQDQAYADEMRSLKASVFNRVSGLADAEAGSIPNLADLQRQNTSFEKVTGSTFTRDVNDYGEAYTQFAAGLTKDGVSVTIEDLADAIGASLNVESMMTMGSPALDAVMGKDFPEVIESSMIVDALRSAGVDEEGIRMSRADKIAAAFAGFKMTRAELADAMAIMHEVPFFDSVGAVTNRALMRAAALTGDADAAEKIRATYFETGAYADHLRSVIHTMVNNSAGFSGDAPLKGMFEVSNRSSSGQGVLRLQSVVTNVIRENWNIIEGLRAVTGSKSVAEQLFQRLKDRKPRIDEVFPDMHGPHLVFAKETTLIPGSVNLDNIGQQMLTRFRHRVFRHLMAVTPLAERVAELLKGDLERTNAIEILEHIYGGVIDEAIKDLSRMTISAEEGMEASRSAAYIGSVGVASALSQRSYGITAKEATTAMKVFERTLGGFHSSQLSGVVPVFGLFGGASHAMREFARIDSSFVGTAGIAMQGPDNFLGSSGRIRNIMSNQTEGDTVFRKFIRERDINELTETDLDVETSPESIADIGDLAAVELLLSKIGSNIQDRKNDKVPQAAELIVSALRAHRRLSEISQGIIDAIDAQAAYMGVDSSLTPSRLISSPTDITFSDTTRKNLARMIADDHVALQSTVDHIGDQRMRAAALLRMVRDLEEDPGVVNPIGTLVTSTFEGDYDNSPDSGNFRLMPHVSTLRSYVPKEGDRRLVITSAHESLISTATDKDVAILSGLETSSSNAPAFSSGKYAAMDYNLSANLFGDRPGEPIGSGLARLAPVMSMIAGDLQELQFADVIQRTFGRISGDRYSSYRHNGTMRKMIHMAGGGLPLYYAAEKMASSSDPSVRALGEALRSVDHEADPKYKNHLCTGIAIGSMVPLLKRVAEVDSLYDAKAPILDLIREYSKRVAENGSTPELVNEFVAKGMGLFSGSSGVGIRRLSQYLSMRYSDSDWQGMARASGVYVFDQAIVPELAKKFNKQEIDFIRREYIAQLAQTNGRSPAYDAVHYNRSGTGTALKVTAEMRDIPSGSYINTQPDIKEALGMSRFMQEIHSEVLGYSDYGAGTNAFLRSLFYLSGQDGVLHTPSAVHGPDGYKIQFASYSPNPDSSSLQLPYDGLVSDNIYSDGPAGFAPATGATIYGPGSAYTTGTQIPSKEGGIAAALLLHPTSPEYMKGIKAMGTTMQTTFSPGKNNRLTKDLVRSHIRQTISRRLSEAKTDVIEIQPASMSLTYRGPSAAHILGARGTESLKEAVFDWHATGIRNIDKGIQYKMGRAVKGNYLAAGTPESLVDRLFGPLTGFAESKPSRGFSWARAANGDILVNISGDHLGYKLDGRAFGKRVGFGFSIAEGVGFDPNKKVLIPAKANMQASMHQILSSYGHFMLDAFDPNSSSMAAAYIKAEAALEGRVHRSRTDAVTPADLKEAQNAIWSSLRNINATPDLAPHVKAAQKLQFGQAAGYVTIRIPAGASMEVVKQMLITAHMDPALTPNYGILGSRSRFEGTAINTANGGLFGNFAEATGSYSSRIKHKIRTFGNNVLAPESLPDLLVNQLTQARQLADPHLVDDIELLVARIMGSENGYFLPDAERKLALDGDTGMAIATLFPGREDLLKYSWDAKAMHGIKVWKRTGPKGDANFRAHVVQFDAPVSMTPEGGLMISKTAVAFKTAAEAEQYANRMSRLMSGAEMVKALSSENLEVVDRPDLAKSKDAFIGDLSPRRMEMITDEGYAESSNGYVVGDLDMVFDQKTAHKVSKALDSRKHIRFRANDTLLMIGNRKVEELEAIVRSKLNFGLPKGPISLKSRAMNAIARGVDHHKRFKESMTGADWFAFMKTNGVSGEELRQSGLGHLFATSLETPLTRMDVAEFFAAMFPNLVKNDFRFSPRMRAIESMTLGIPSEPGSNVPAFVSRSGWHMPYIQNAAIQSVANMKMSIDAVRAPIEGLEIRMSEANARGDADAVAKLTTAIDVIRASAISAAERLGVEGLEGASTSTILRVMDEKLRGMVRGLEGETSTTSSIAKLADRIDFKEIEGVRQKYNDEVAKLLKDQQILNAISGIVPEIYAPLRLMEHGWIGATKPEIGMIPVSGVSRSNSSRTYGFGSNYAETTGQVLGSRAEGWDSYSTGRQQMGTNTVIQFYDNAKQDEINDYISDLTSAAKKALDDGDTEKHKAAMSLLSAAKRVATVRAAIAGLGTGMGGHFHDYLPSRSIDPRGGEYEMGHYRYSLNISLAGLSLPIFDRPDALLIGPEQAGLPRNVQLEKLGFPVMMMEEFQSDLFQKFGGIGVVEDTDAFLPANSEEAAKMANVPKIKEAKEKVAQLEAIRDNATKHMLESLLKVVSDSSFTDLSLRLQLNNLDLMNKMFITATAPGFFRGTGRNVAVPATLKRSIKAQAGFDLPDLMPVTEPDVELIKLVMLSGKGSSLSKEALKFVSERMEANIRSSSNVHSLFNTRGMNVGNMIDAIRNDPRRAAQQSFQSIEQLIHKANTDMMSENYLSRIMPSLENAPEGDLKELLKGLNQYLENIDRLGSGIQQSTNLIAIQLASVMLLDEKFVLEVSQSAETGARIDYEIVARRALENIRARFADTKSFNGKTIMTSLEVMLGQGSEPKPFPGFRNGFSNGIDLGFDDYVNTAVRSGELSAEDMANIENIPLNELLTKLGISETQHNNVIRDLAWQIDSYQTNEDGAVFIERGAGPLDNGPQRNYIVIRTKGLTGDQVANRLFLEALRAKKEGRTLGSFILSDYDRYSGTQAGGFARSIGELFKAMVNKQNIQPEIDSLKADIATMSKGVPEMGSYRGAGRGSDAIMPNALPMVDINGYKSAHLSMAIIDSMNHGMRGVGLYDASFQLERGHGLNGNPSLFLGIGKDNRFVFKAGHNDETTLLLQAILYSYEKLVGQNLNAENGPHAGFMHRLNNMSGEEAASLILGNAIEHNGFRASLGNHVAAVFMDIASKLPQGMVNRIFKGYGQEATNPMAAGSPFILKLAENIDRSAKREKGSGSARMPAYHSGKKAENPAWDDTAFKFNANAMKESGLTIIPQNTHGSAGWGYVTNYGLPGWKVDMMMVGAGPAFRNLYSLDAFERPKFEVRGPNMVLLDPKTGREIVSVDVTSERGMRIFREKYLQASKYKGGNWAINAFMKEWGAAGGYVDMTTLADLPGFKKERSGYGHEQSSPDMAPMIRAARDANQNDPMAAAILEATKQGKLSPMGFIQDEPFGGRPRIPEETVTGILSQAGAITSGRDPVATRQTLVGSGSLAGELATEVQQGESPSAMPSWHSFAQYGMVSPQVYAMVMGGGDATPESIAHTLIRVRNPIVTTLVHTPEMRTKEHENAFRSKIISGVNLLMISGQRPEPGKPVSPELISALAQLANKVNAMGMGTPERQRALNYLKGQSYQDVREVVPITYTQNLMVDRSKLPDLPVARKPAARDPNDGRLKIYDRELVTKLLKEGYSDLMIAKHVGVARGTILKHRSVEGIAPLPEGGYRGHAARNSISEEEIIKRRDKVIAAFLKTGSAREAYIKTGLSQYDHRSGEGMDKMRAYAESKGVQLPKRGKHKQKAAAERRRKVEPSPSDSLSDPTHEAQIRKTPNQSDLMKREQLEGDMNG